MPSILNLKFKGNKSFVAFSNLSDGDALTKTWKVCTKVASFLEQGQRLENLSWRLWHLQNLMVDTDNAKSKREFKKLSKCMGDKLDKEKGRSIEELEAPDFKRNPSVEMIRQRAAEKERMREANQHQPGTINRMQFTFSVDQPARAPMTTTVRKPDPSANAKRGRGDAPNTAEAESSKAVSEPASLKFPSLFSNDFGPSALLYPTPTLTNTMNYGEGLNPSTNADTDSFSVARPTIELPLDELLHNVDSNDNDTWISSLIAAANLERQSFESSADQDVTMAPSVPSSSNKRPASAMADESGNVSDDETSEPSPVVPAPRTTKKHTRSHSKSVSSITVPPLSQAVKEILPETVSPSRVNELFGTSSSAPPRSSSRPTLTVRTQAATPTTRSSGPGATATSLNPAVLRGSSGNSAPGGVKAECSNCGATHTPLWRRGLNDELNCNACGLYCKLHKRPRPKSMRNNHGEGRAQAAPRQETVDVMAQCYNCHTTATPLWRKDDEGKTVCNACGLYYKLHGTARPISMKSDVIRKRSRHDARRANSIEDTPSASPGVSRRTSPVPESNQPTLAPDTSTAAYEYNENHNSELMHALGDSATNIFTNAYNYQFPGPYHPDHLVQMYTTAQENMTFTSSEPEVPMSPPSNKRRRMSTDSASEPPTSAVSFGSFNDGYSSTSSSTSHSQRSSMDFPFSSMGPSGPALRGSGNTFWHPPMLPQGDDAAQVYAMANNNNNNNNNQQQQNSGSSGSSGGSESDGSPQSSASGEDSPMDYLHPPMLPQEEELFSTYLHPPMALPSEDQSHSQMHGTLHYDYSQAYDSHDSSMRVY
ncbi:GATA-binding factor 6-B [Ephemerocybe angulata]|uniref:GATA-binding factor 6-B n=1 Tax=Ephemerocybe angulata TaxID=980116 RepID=A0A8H6HM22_9AGAR|nr:GATA-binding factor 6-B [Tulosesus angulatus]